MALFVTDTMAADAYIAMVCENVRRQWVRIQLKKLGWPVDDLEEEAALEAEDEQAKLAAARAVRLAKNAAKRAAQEST